MNPDLAAALVAESQTAPLKVVDFLVEYEVPLVDVLLLYAGTPPDWDGLPQEVLAEWLSRQVPADTERMVKVAGCEARQLPPGTDGVSRWYTVFRWVDDVSGGCMWQAEAAARRYLKRRVLSLFGEVSAERCQTFKGGQVIDLRAYGLDPYKPLKTRHSPANLTITFTQTLSAPDWVPPHEEERARVRRSPISPRPTPDRRLSERPLRSADTPITP